MRKLASIRQITNITPIEGGDRIETATVDGWKIIVGKGLYQPGDKAIYCEIDSALPLDQPGIDDSGDLRKRGVKNIDGREYHVLKSVKMRGVVSQGMLLPVNIVPTTLWEKIKSRFGAATFQLGQDVSERLGIVKWDPWAPKDERVSRKNLEFPRGNLIAPFPTGFARKSDSERAQNLTNVWEELKKHKWDVTEKIDGQSVTLINDGGEIRVASRNYEIADHSARAWAARNGFLDAIPDGFAVQGEWAGEGVQGNGLKLSEPRLFVFDFFDHGKPALFNDWCAKYSVPIISVESDLPDSVGDAVEFADGLKSLVNPNVLAEGVVFRESRNHEFSKLGGRATFKAINNKWLLKNK